MSSSTLQLEETRRNHVVDPLQTLLQVCDGSKMPASIAVASDSRNSRLLMHQHGTSTAAFQHAKQIRPRHEHCNCTFNLLALDKRSSPALLMLNRSQKSCGVSRLRLSVDVPHTKRTVLATSKNDLL
jgi:hypothetical protein